jgi:reductive dehalogenase
LTSQLAILNHILLLLGGGISLLFLAFGAVSLREREQRATWIALALASLLPSPYLIVALGRFPFQPILAASLLVVTGMVLLAFALPLGRPDLAIDSPRARVDERDIMFARARLVPGSREYQAYYARRPEKKAIDDRIRAAPGLYRPAAKFYHRLGIPAADASFAAIDGMQGAVDGPVASETVPVSPDEITRFIKGVTGHYGACAVGITELHDYHLYTHIGRGEGTYGDPIALDHRYAIAFTVEMSRTMLRRAPAAPEAMEVSKQYLAAAAIAVQLALLIRSLGYPARAHIDGNYRVICPLVARDAGLGEIGRMGLLMTPRQGPRVRIGVVTTDLPLVPDHPAPDLSIVDFCRRCVKCAENCPSRSIPFGDRREIEGARRWRINSETCFHYWNVAGTDCGRCVMVCPYSHTDNLAHSLVRWSIRRSVPARRFALWMDDLFYGRRPGALDLPDWL